MSTNPDYITIKDYLAGKLDARVAHELEKRALEDPFLSDAIEGYRSAHAPSDHQLSILQRQLEERIAIQQENKNRFNFNTQRLSIAAAAGLLFITAGLLFWMKMPHPSEQVAQFKKVDVELTPQNVKPEPQTVEEANSLKSKVNTSGPQVAVITRPAPSVAVENKSTGLVSKMAMSKAAPMLTGGAVTTFRGNPLPGVAVGIKGSPATTFTDDNGRFSLPGDVMGTLILAAVGYQTVEVKVNAGDKILITLNEDPGSSAISLAGIQPKGGRPAFDQYVAKNINYSSLKEKAAGEVILSFAVNSKGRPENIRIVKSLNTASNSEAMRVLNIGPDWQLNGLNESSETQVSIKFKP